MTFEEYQKEAVSYRTETANNEEYLTLGLIEEVGEAAGKLAKRRRDGVWDEKAFIKELGDILWFVANLADFYERDGRDDYLRKLRDCFDTRVKGIQSDKDTLIWLLCDASNFLEGFDSLHGVAFELACLAKRHGYTLEQVAEINLAKLRDRAARGKIHANGDER